MKNNVKIQEIIKMKIKDNDFRTAIILLENKIKEIFIKRIEKHNKNFKYIDLINLSLYIKEYLSKEEQILFEKYFIIVNEENNELYELDCLVEILNNLEKR